MEAKLSSKSWWSSVSSFTETIFYCGLRTVEATEKAVTSLDHESALGHNLVPTRILKKCTKVFASVLHVLISAIVKFGQWPTGIHLTSHRSKIAERVIASLFVPQFIYNGVCGRMNSDICKNEEHVTLWLNLC